MIDKTLYGLRNSGIRWHEKFADCLRDIGFTPPDTWKRLNTEFSIYKYIAVYIEDRAIAAKDCKEINDILTNKYKFY